MSIPSSTVFVFFIAISFNTRPASFELLRGMDATVNLDLDESCCPLFQCLLFGTNGQQARDPISQRQHNCRQNSVLKPNAALVGILAICFSESFGHTGHKLSTRYEGRNVPDYR